MPTLDLIAKAFQFALEKHKGQVDDEGKDYFRTHVGQVAHIVTTAIDDDEMIAAAYLHDTLEDTDTSLPELTEEFGERVADLVYEVTHEGQKDHYGYYFPRLKSKDAIIIKLADRINNLTRMGGWDIARREDYLKKTRFWKDGTDKTT